MKKELSLKEKLAYAKLSSKHGASNKNWTIWCSTSIAVRNEKSILLNNRIKAIILLFHLPVYSEFHRFFVF